MWWRRSPPDREAGTATSRTFARRAMLGAGAVLVLHAGPVWAQDTSPPPKAVPAAATTTCDGREVCGVMFHDRFVPYSNACRARMAGAARILVGPCDDDD